MGMQIPTTHEARLGRMGMDPAQDHEILAIDVVEQRGLVHHLARIRRALLLGNDELRHEERVRDQRAAQDPARFEIGPRVAGRERQEGAAQRRGEEDGAQRYAGFEVGRRLEGEG